MTSPGEKRPDFSVAPMLDHTDRHGRFVLRLFSRRARLYSEMITSNALIHGDSARHLDYHPNEQPLFCQLAGSNPDEMARASRIVRHWNYAGINLNCGCPSSRVTSGHFGACLMREPERVATICKAMREASGYAVSVKCRLGVDDQDGVASLDRFVEEVAEKGGVKHFIIHARMAWLEGLSPKKNREIPPLDYSRVGRLKARFPELKIDLNGGISTPKEALKVTQSLGLDGAMMGRAVCENPQILGEVDPLFFNLDTPVLSEEKLIEALVDYAGEQARNKVPFYVIARHCLPLFKGKPGARRWRQVLSEQGPLNTALPELFHAAYEEAFGR